jgi:hypothetical protein
VQRKTEVPQDSVLEEKKVRLSAPDDWTLIEHIGRSQSTDPRRSLKELVDNAIDAFSREPSYSPKKGKIVSIKINRNSTHDWIKVVDNAVGWEPDSTGKPNFEFSAQHIGDSIKKKIVEFQRAREEGKAIGQYALGLLSFWALGNRLTIFSRCRLSDGRVGNCSKMVWLRSVREASIVDITNPPEELAESSGCVAVVDQLEKARMYLITGNQLKVFLARACRSRLMKTGVTVEIECKGKKEIVRPMKYEGTPFPLKQYQTKNGFGTVELEIFLPPKLESPDEEYRVPIFSRGAKVYDDITEIEELDIYPWNAKKVYGQIDYPYGNITPSRNAFVNDDFLEAFIQGMKEITKELSMQVDELEAFKRKRTRKKFYEVFEKTWQEILNGLPEEWQRRKESLQRTLKEMEESEKPEVKPGPMHRLEVSPEDTQVQCHTVQSFTAKPYDKDGNLVRDPEIIYYWKIEPGHLGQLKRDTYRTCILQGGKEAGIITIIAMAFQQPGESEEEKAITKIASTNVWIVNELTKKPPRPPLGDKPPSFEEIPLEEGIHSKYLPNTKVVQVNNQHRDYKEAEKRDLETLYKYINFCYCKEIAVDRWKDLTADPHELSERIADLVAISELAFDWKALTQKPRGRPSAKESAVAWGKRALSS